MKEVSAGEETSAWRTFTSAESQKSRERLRDSRCGGGAVSVSSPVGRCHSDNCRVSSFHRELGSSWNMLEAVGPSFQLVLSGFVDSGAVQ